MIAAMIPWLIGIGGLVLMLALVIGGALYMSGTLSEQERREIGLAKPQMDTEGHRGEEHTLTTIRCARPGCGRLHTQAGLFCSEDCYRVFHARDGFAGLAGRVACN